MDYRRQDVDAIGGQSGLESNQASRRSDVNESEVINLFVLIDNITRRYRLQKQMTVRMLKKQLARSTQTEVDDIRLIYTTKELDDQKTLRDYQISEDATLRVLLRLRGGMPKKKVKGSTKETLDTIGTESEELEVNIQEELEEMIETPIVTQQEKSKLQEVDLMKVLQDHDQLIRKIALHLDKVDEKNENTNNMSQTIRNEMFKEFRNVKDVFQDIEERMAETEVRSLEDKVIKDPEPDKIIHSEVLPVLSNTFTSNFDVKKEVEYLHGKVAEQKRKPAKEITFKGLPVYNLSTPFDEWWKTFKFHIRSAGLVGQINQIRHSFITHMDQTIKTYFEQLTDTKDMNLSELIEVILSYYDKNSKNLNDYEKEFVNFRKNANETVALYQIRLETLSDKAQIKDRRRIKNQFVEGLFPVSLYIKVVDRITETMTFEEVLQIALKIEKDYIRTSKRDIKQKIEPSEEKTKKEFKRTIIQSRVSSSTNSVDNKRKYEIDTCQYCLKKHDYKECAKKFKFYTFQEAQLLSEVGKQPTIRTEVPKVRLTKDTPWIKIILDKKTSGVRNVAELSAQTVESSVNVSDPNLKKHQNRVRI